MSQERFVRIAGWGKYLPERIMPNAELATLVWFGGVEPWRDGRRRHRMAQAARGEAWSFASWYDRERRRRPR